MVCLSDLLDVVILVPTWQNCSLFIVDPHLLQKRARINGFVRINALLGRNSNSSIYGKLLHNEMEGTLTVQTVKSQFPPKSI